MMETERLLIRRFEASDWKDLYDYLSDEDVVKFEPYSAYTVEQCKTEAKWRADQDFFLAVCLKSTGKLIGNVYFQRQEPAELLTWEIGYVFNAGYQKKGYAAESCAAVIKNAFDNLQARRIVAMCDPQNTASWRLLERLSFRREGYLLKNIFFEKDAYGNPIWKDTYEYAILANEWNKLNLENSIK